MNAWTMISNKKRMQEANRAAISSADCDAAVEYLDAYLDLKEKENDDESGTSDYSVHREGLLLAAIVAYCRAVTKSKGNAFVTDQLQVDFAKVFNDDQAAIELHNLLIEKRNKAVAHSDWEYRRSEFDSITPAGGIVRTGTNVIYGEGIDIELFRTVARVMSDHFHFEAFKRDLPSSPTESKRL
jgi:hypothetical protein